MLVLVLWGVLFNSKNSRKSFPWHEQNNKQAFDVTRSWCSVLSVFLPLGSVIYAVSLSLCTAGYLGLKESVHGDSIKQNDNLVIESYTHIPDLISIIPRFHPAYYP